MKVDAYNFTIYDVENVHADLVAELENNESVHVDLEGVEKVDMAALQLLVSAKRSCHEVNKTFVLSNLSDEVATAIRMSGLESELGV